MYPTITSQTPSPSAPPAPQSTTSSNLHNTTTSLSNTSVSNPIGFSSFMSQPPNQNNPQSMQPRNNAPYSQPPYPVGQPSFPTGPGQASPYGNLNASQPPQPPHNQYSQYSTPQPPQGFPQGQNQYGPPVNLQNPGNLASAYSQPYSSQPPQRPMNPSNATSYQNPYGANNPYAPPPPPQNNPGANPYNYQAPNQYGQGPPNQSAYGNPYQPYNPQPGPPPPQNAPYGTGPQGGPYGNYSGYAQQQQAPYQSPYAQAPPGAPGYNQNQFGAGPIRDRLRAIAGRYEISDALAERLNILQQFELVVLCDDSGSMNSPVQGTNGSRWDELRTIVKIIIEIGALFDSNGVDVHFLNRPAMQNVTDVRQVIESFQAPPSGLTPLTPALRRIFQSAAGKHDNNKRLLVFVATDGAPTDSNGNVDIRGLENLLRNERQANSTFVTFLACTDDEQSVSYLSDWDRTMLNVDVVDDYKSEREEVLRVRGPQHSFTFGDYVVKALLGAIDPQIDMLDEPGNRSNYRPY